MKSLKDVPQLFFLVYLCLLFSQVNNYDATTTSEVLASSSRLGVAVAIRSASKETNESGEFYSKKSFSLLINKSETKRVEPNGKDILYTACR